MFDAFTEQQYYGMQPRDVTHDSAIAVDSELECSVLEVEDLQTAACALGEYHDRPTGREEVLAVLEHPDDAVLVASLEGDVPRDLHQEPHPGHPEHGALRNPRELSPGADKVEDCDVQRALVVRDVDHTLLPVWGQVLQALHDGPRRNYAEHEAPHNAPVAVHSLGRPVSASEQEVRHGQQGAEQASIHPR